jgi:2'-phosphotransferase
VCVHGTYSKNLESILEFGLKRMKRLHVHFSCGLPTDGEVISGNISSSFFILFINKFFMPVGFLTYQKKNYACRIYYA